MRYFETAESSGNLKISPDKRRFTRTCTRTSMRDKTETGDTHLADYLETARARSLVCRSVGPA